MIYHCGAGRFADLLGNFPVSGECRLEVQYFFGYIYITWMSVSHCVPMLICLRITYRKHSPRYFLAVRERWRRGGIDQTVKDHSQV